jgi:hypothetical protein
MDRGRRPHRQESLRCIRCMTCTERHAGEPQVQETKKQKVCVKEGIYEVGYMRKDAMNIKPMNKGRRPPRLESLRCRGRGGAKWRTGRERALELGALYPGLKPTPPKPGRNPTPTARTLTLALRQAVAQQGFWSSNLHTLNPQSLTISTCSTIHHFTIPFAT